MRAHTKRKHKMGKRFAIVIGVAAAGVMALGAQTVLAGVDSVPPDLQLSGDKTQNPQKKKNPDGPICDRGLCHQVKVRVSCGDEACTARAKGKLTKVNKDKLRVNRNWRVAPGKTILPGETSHVDLELANAAQRREVRKALAKGKNVKAKVTVRATDAAGNVATAKRRVKLVK